MFFRSSWRPRIGLHRATSPSVLQVAYIVYHKKSDLSTVEITRFDLWISTGMPRWYHLT